MWQLVCNNMVNIPKWFSKNRPYHSMFHWLSTLNPEPSYTTFLRHQTKTMNHTITSRWGINLFRDWSIRVGPLSHHQQFSATARPLISLFVRLNNQDPLWFMRCARRTTGRTWCVCFTLVLPFEFRRDTALSTFAGN